MDCPTYDRYRRQYHNQLRRTNIRPPPAPSLDTILGQPHIPTHAHTRWNTQQRQQYMHILNISNSLLRHINDTRQRFGLPSL
jgi:hypothetical protein